MYIMRKSGGKTSAPAHFLAGSAKTVVDCFKHRNKIGLDVALEAQGVDFKQVLVRFALERILYRLGQSERRRKCSHELLQVTAIASKWG